MGGVSPADVTSLILHLELDKRQQAAERKREEVRAAAEAHGNAAAEAHGNLSRDEDSEMAEA